MRIYLSGKFSKPVKDFLPEDLWFADDDCSDTTIAAKNCVRISGLECECSVDEESNTFSARWKGVTMEAEQDYGETFSKENFLSLIKDRNLHLRNMSFFTTDSDFEIEVEDVMILDGEWGSETYLRSMNIPFDTITVDG